MSIISNVSETFVSLINKYKDRTDIEIELQIPYSTNLTSIFTNIKPTAYIEYIHKNFEENYKYRKRVSIDNISGYDMNISNLKNIESGTWEKKINIYNEKKENGFIYKVSKEEVLEEYNMLFNYDFVYYLVVKYFINTDNFKIEFKIKYFIGKSIYTDQIVKFLNNVKNYKYSPIFSFEIEYNNNNINLYENIYNLLKKIIGDNVVSGDIFENVNLPLIEEIVEITEEHKQLRITPKFDGTSYDFMYENNTLIIKETIAGNNGFYFKYDTNSFSNKKIYGRGEIIFKDKIQYFYIFHIMCDKNNIPMEDFSKYINIKKETSLPFIICFKKSYKFEDKFEEFYNNDYYDGFKTDGLIILNNKIDYKYKKNKSADYLFRALMTFGGISKNEKEESIYFRNIFLLNNSYKEGDIILNIKLNDSLKIENSLPIIYTYDELGNRYIYSIYVMIEFTKDAFIKIRKYKTDKSINKRSYLGNSLEVGNMVLGKKNENLENVKILNKESLKINYWVGGDKSNRKKDSLSIITNFVKTQVISLYHSHILNGKRLNVLDIDMGRCGDMFKHFYSHSNIYVGTDTNYYAVESAKKRYYETFGNNQTKQGKNKTAFNFHPLNICILDKKFSNYITQCRSFDAITWYLAMHYSYCNENKVIIMYNLYKLSKPGTIFSAILFDGKKIKKMKLPYEYDLKDDTKLIIKKGNEENTILVSHPNFGEKEEFIVDLDDFKNEMKNIKFVEIEKCTFNDILYITKNRLKDMEILEFNKSTLSILNLIKNVIDNKEYDYNLMDLFTVIVYKRF